MSIESIETSTVGRLAKRLEEHIVSTGLGPGDRYLTAIDAGRLLGVSTATAHRAMQDLANRRLLLRHRGRGTFVGPHFESKGINPQSTKIRTLHILIQDDHQYDSPFSVDAFVRKMHKQFSGANIQLNLSPTGDGVEQVRRFVGATRSTGEILGILLVSCPRDVYRYAAETGLPVVVFGSLYPDQQDLLVSVDADHYESGRLLTQHLIDRGHRRIALFSNAVGRPGDNDFFDGVSYVLTDAGLPHSSLTVRNVPHELKDFANRALEAVFDKLMAMPDPPTGIIVRTPSMARDAISSTRLSSVDGVEIVSQNSASNEWSLPCTCVRSTLSFQDVVELISRMLKQLSNNENIEQRRVVIPVELEVREQWGAS